VIWLIPVIHYLADFEAQTDWMAINKSKRWDALTLHCLVYSLFFGLVFGWQFMLITFASHFVTDAITSRITSKLWLAERRHRFFCVIGLDQMIHTYTLFATYLYLFS
jgi:hypothetical protein